MNFSLIFFGFHFKINSIMSFMEVPFEIKLKWPRQLFTLNEIYQQEAVK